MPYKGKGMTRTLVAVALASVVLVTDPAAAQTLFIWPDSAIDVSRYPTIEDCHAAAQRVMTTLSRNEFFEHRIWRDTLPNDPAEEAKPVPAAVREAVRSCGAKFASADSVSLEDYRILLPLYIVADWDDQARRLVARRLEVAARESDEVLTAVLDTVVAIYSGNPRNTFRGLPGISVRPPRLDLVEEVVQEYLPRITDRVFRIKLLMAQLHASRRGEARFDSARIEWVAPQILALVDSLTDAEKEKLAEELTGFSEDKSKLEERLYRRIYASIESDSKRRALLDSLRHSTAAYAREFRRQQPRSANVPYGEPAPMLEADIWLGCGDRCEPRPAPGRVSLVVFFYHSKVRERPREEHVCTQVITNPQEVRAQCARLVYTLRRLIERFPELDVTIVTRTFGFFGFVKENVTAEVEAELLRRWLESFGVRATIAMTETQHWRLPNHDRRRIDEPTVNEVNYSFNGPAAPRNNGWSVLIDEDGKIVYDTIILPDRRYDDRETRLAEMIEVLLDRSRPRT